MFTKGSVRNKFLMEIGYFLFFYKSQLFHVIVHADAMICFICESGNANLRKNHFKFRPFLPRKKQHMLFKGWHKHGYD